MVYKNFHSNNFLSLNDGKTLLDQEMAWCQSDTKRLLEPPMMATFYHVPLSINELSKFTSTTTAEKRN